MYDTLSVNLSLKAQGWKTRAFVSQINNRLIAAAILHSGTKKEKEQNNPKKHQNMTQSITHVV
jgi:hypothetical protein